MQKHAACVKPSWHRWKSEYHILLSMQSTVAENVKMCLPWRLDKESVSYFWVHSQGGELRVSHAAATMYFQWDASPSAHLQGWALFDVFCATQLIHRLTVAYRLTLGKGSQDFSAWESMVWPTRTPTTLVMPLLKMLIALNVQLSGCQLIRSHFYIFRVSSLLTTKVKTAEPGNKLDQGKQQELSLMNVCTCTSMTSMCKELSSPLCGWVQNNLREDSLFLLGEADETTSQI